MLVLYQLKFGNNQALPGQKDMRSELMSLNAQTQWEKLFIRRCSDSIHKNLDLGEVLFNFGISLSAES